MGSESVRPVSPRGLTASIFFSFLLGITMICIFLYLMVRTSLFFLADYSLLEKWLALALLMAEGFTMLHAFGYFLNLFHVARHPERERRISMDNVPALDGYPPVAIVVSSFHEPLDVIEDTLTCFYNLTYPNKHIYFLDDTRYDVPGRDLSEYRARVDDLCGRIGVNLFRRPWRGAKAGMINDFLAYLHGNPPEGFVMESFEDVPSALDEKYIIIFDADMNPLPDFVEPLVAFMEDNPRLAFIQTPQYYSNFEHNRVARAAGLQQAVFYEYICEGKSMQDAMFCCGTNVIFNRAALWDVGGFDESSVTEDFATSLRFHERGWSSAYLNKICAFGMGPEDMGGYFKQQFRWALGTVGLFRTILGAFFRNPGRMSAAKWWEYFLSGTHYFVGWVLFVMMACPVLFLLFDIPSYFARPEIYFLFFVPYILLTLSLFLYSMSQRRYSFIELAQGIILQAICFPVYMKASLLGILGVRGTFGITPKAGAVSLPMRGLWVQVGMAALCFGSVWWAGLRLWYEGTTPLAMATNAAWCFYHFMILSMVFWFNFPEERRP
jgi:cellulose synthase (UDP-forming)